MHLDCGRYQAISHDLPENSDERVEVIIEQAGRPLKSVKDQRVTAIECRDVTGDSVPELIVRTSTGGAHCCETLRIFSLGNTPSLLLAYENGNSEGFELTDLSGDGRRQLFLYDDSFAYFHDLCFACSPGLPLLVCYTDAAFHDCTTNFPGLLQATRDKELDRLREQLGYAAADEESMVYRKSAEGAAAAVVAISLLLGEDQRQGVDIVKSVTSMPN